MIAVIPRNPKGVPFQVIRTPMSALGTGVYPVVSFFSVCTVMKTYVCRIPSKLEYKKVRDPQDFYCGPGECLLSFLHRVRNCDAMRSLIGYLYMP